MNIFILDPEIEVNVTYYIDKHVVKMVTEYAQILSSVLLLCGVTSPYKLTHKDHPAVKWAKESLENYQYLWNLCNRLGQEYTHRYGKSHRAHKTLLEKIPYNPSISQLGLTKFINCTPYKDITDPISAYRKYYCIDKSYFAKWTKRPIPDWFVDRREST